MNILESKIVYINSKNRITGTPENFMYQVPISSNDKFDSVCVLQVCIPISYYLVQSGYNTFILKEGSSSVTITVPPGNYNSSSFATVIVALLNSNSPYQYTYTMTMPNTYATTSTGKYTFTVSDDIYTPSLIFGNNSLHEQFGFNSGSTNTFNNKTIISTNVVNFINESTLFIYSDMVDATTNTTQYNVLQEIYNNNCSPLQNITYQCVNVESYSKKLNSNSSNIFHFNICNENNELIQLNGQNWLLTLLLYRKNDLNDIQRQFIKYSLLKK